jgi:hypothetical protein
MSDAWRIGILLFFETAPSWPRVSLLTQVRFLRITAARFVQNRYD